MLQCRAAKETIRNNEHMRPIQADDFHQAISNNKSTMGSWYGQAVKELEGRTNEEQQYFSALFDGWEAYKGK